MELLLPFAAFLFFLALHLTRSRARGQTLNEYLPAQQAHDLRNPVIYFGAAGIVVVFLSFSIVSNDGVPSWSVFIVLVFLAFGLATVGYWLSSRSGPT